MRLFHPVSIASYEMSDPRTSHRGAQLYQTWAFRRASCGRFSAVSEKKSNKSGSGTVISGIKGLTVNILGITGSVLPSTRIGTSILTIRIHRDTSSPHYCVIPVTKDSDERHRAIITRKCVGSRSRDPFGGAFERLDFYGERSWRSEDIIVGAGQETEVLVHI